MYFAFLSLTIHFFLDQIWFFCHLILPFTQKMHEYRDKAIQILDKYADCAAKESLINLVNYTVERKK